MNTFLTRIVAFFLLASPLISYSGEQTSSADDETIEELFNKVKEITVQDIEKAFDLLIDHQTRTFKSGLDVKYVHLNYFKGHTICFMLINDITLISRLKQDRLINHFITPCITFYDNDQKVIQASALNDRDKKKNIDHIEILKKAAQKLMTPLLVDEHTKN